MVSTVSPLVWVLTIVGLAALIVLDLAVIARRRRRVTTRDAVIWISVYIGIAALFAIGLFLWSPGSRGGEFVAGYVTEYSLSVDNLFVFMLIMARFAVPPDTEDAALYIGIVLSLLLRAIFIFAGAAAISAFSWIFFVLGAFLIFTAIRLVTQGENDDGDFRENAVIRMLRRMLPLSTDYDGPRFTTRVDGRRLLTPLVIVIVAIGMANVIFALDSMPAIFGLTQDAYVILTANALALMGLRHLYFIIGRLLTRIVLLNFGLAAILAFIGVKLVFEALRDNGVDRVGPVPVPDIGVLASLIVIVVVLVVTTLTSLAVSAVHDRRAANTGPAPMREPGGAHD